MQQTPWQDREVWELCCHEQSTLTEAALARGLAARRLTLETGYDFTTNGAVRKAKRLALKLRPRKAWLSPPCTPWCQWQNTHQRTSSQRRTLRKKRLQSRRLLRGCLRLLLIVVLKCKGDFYFEWPTGNLGWSLPALKTFQERLRARGVKVHRCRVDGCQYGMMTLDGAHFVRKRWTILTSDAAMKVGLEARCRERVREHSHAMIQGRETPRSGFYPPRMASRIAEIWKQSGEIAA